MEKIDLEAFLESLKKNANEFALSEINRQCDELVAFLYRSDDVIPLKKAESVLQVLRNKRQFAAMIKVADALVQSGRRTYKIQRQFAQALADTGNFTTAVLTIRSLIDEIEKCLPSDRFALVEYPEAKGLMGRIYKQLYVNIRNPKNPQCVHYLDMAVRSYYAIYEKDPGRVWHGINTVALLERARRDEVVLSLKEDEKAMAGRILTHIQDKHVAGRADAWDFATAAEACVALDRGEEALKWLSGYARMPYCDAFELASTLRQLEEVWQLDLNSEIGQLLLPILRAELADRSGSEMVLDISELKRQLEANSSIDEKYRQLTEDRLGKPGAVVLEKVFGEDSFKTYRWYMKGATRCISVARIGSDATRGVGTGFLIAGKELNPAWGDELFLVTNAHVVSSDPTERTLHPDNAVIIFEALDASEEFMSPEIVWSSPSTELDVTILRFQEVDRERLLHLLKGEQGYKVFTKLPVIESPPTQKIYVIGHPSGGTLQISFQDNLLVDHDSISKIHYRTPTEGGSSGSPVFNQQWDFIGIHHAGSTEMPRLRGETGTYEANEGIWMEAVRRQIKKEEAAGLNKT